MAFSGSQITRLGLYGAARGLYGSFAGKGAVPPAEEDLFDFDNNVPIGTISALDCSRRMVVYLEKDAELLRWLCLSENASSALPEEVLGLTLLGTTEENT